MKSSSEASSFEDSGHPILAVMGKPAKLSDLCRLWVDEKTESFSTSLCDILKDASTRAEKSKEGFRVVDVPIILDAVVDYGKRWREGNTGISLKIALLEFVDTQLKKTPSNAATEAQNNTHAKESEGALEEAVASPWLTNVLGEACATTYRLERRKANTGVSEFLVACLATRNFQFELFPVEKTQRARENALGKLRGAGKDTLSQTSDQHIDDWLEILQTVKAVKLPGPVAESERNYVADRPLESLAEDVIGTSEDARALAEVVCLKTPGPPLAVGLFGDWGSGKSTFMNLLEASIEEISSQVTETKPAGGDSHEGGSASAGEANPFIRKAVHIRFNAWTYNDANLWASLASEFFQQLRCGGYRRKVQADYQRLVDRVARRVTEAEGVAAAKADAAVNARAKVRKLQAEIRSGEQAMQRLDADMADSFVRDLAQEALAKEGPVRQALDALGYSRTDTDESALAKRIAGDVEAITRAPGRVLALWQVVKLLLARGPYQGFGWLFWGLLAATAALGLWALAGELSGFFSLLPGLGVLYPVWRVARPILDRVGTYVKDKETKARTLEQALDQNRTALAAQERAAVDAEAAYAKAETQAARFRGRRPEQVLDFFLGESKELRALEDELGTVSRVRRAFEELNAIMTALWAAQKKLRGETPSDEEKRLLAEMPELEKEVVPSLGSAGKGTAAGAKGRLKKPAGSRPVLPELDRIVIYIDDLDRCRAQQVVKVLEAVQLLLAFQLFVVVVGVDPRWLVNSLRHFYRSELGTRQVTDDGDEMLSAVPKEYLEKIFQIPITLRQLTTGSEGTFRSLVDSLAGAEGQGEPVQHVKVRVTPATGEKLFSIQPAEVKLPEERETMEEKVERIAIKEDERQAITTMGALAGRSPRAVKRLVNVYRFVRSLYRGADLDVFLGDGTGKGTRPLYPGVLFWLALDSGMRAEQVQRMRAAVSSMDAGKCLISDLVSPVKPSNTRGASHVPATARESLESFWRIVPAEDQGAYTSAFEVLEKVLAGHPGFEVLQKTLEDTLRFSFAGMMSQKGS